MKSYPLSLKGGLHKDFLFFWDLKIRFIEVTNCDFKSRAKWKLGAGHFEKAFENSSFKPKDLGETSMMFLVHNTLKPDEVKLCARVIREFSEKAKRPFKVHYFLYSILILLLRFSVLFKTRDLAS